MSGFHSSNQTYRLLSHHLVELHFDLNKYQTCVSLAHVCVTCLKSAIIVSCELLPTVAMFSCACAAVNLLVHKSCDVLPYDGCMC